MDEVQAVLQEMRRRFIEELPERCDDLENLVLRLEQSSGDHASLGELLRGVHSLKGAGGTHGLGIVTTICHQLEDVLDTATVAHLDQSLASAVLAHIDALRRAAAMATEPNPDFGSLTAALAKLRHPGEARRRQGLVVDASTTMTRIYQAALAALPVDLCVVPSGDEGLARLMRDSFDFVILGGEVGTTNGVELARVLRTAPGRNRDVPLILVTGNPQAVPPTHPFTRIVTRDQSLADALQTAVAAVIAM